MVEQPKCQEVIVWSSINADIKLIYLSVLPNARIVVTPDRLESNCEIIEDLATESKRLL